MNFLIRADSNTEIGSGHIMRCIALAEELNSQGHKVIFCCATILAHLKSKVWVSGCKLIEINAEIGSKADLFETHLLLEKLNIRAVILDGYEFQANYLSSLHQVTNLIFLDDEARLENIAADIVINSSPAALDISYKNNVNKTKLLLGPEYALIRNEFRSRSSSISTTIKRSNILVTFGGTDPALLSVPVLKSLLKHIASDTTIDMVISSECGISTTEQVRVHRNCNDMGWLMAQAGYAVSAGGNTINELSVMQVPTVLVIVADNQETHAKWARSNGTNIVIDARFKDKNVVAEQISAAIVNIVENEDIKTKLCDNSKSLIYVNGVCKIVSEIIKLSSNGLKPLSENAPSQ